MIALLLALFVVLLAFYRLFSSPSTAKSALPLAAKKPSALEKLLTEAFEHVPADPTNAHRVLVLYGTEYGFAKEVALKLAAQLAAAGLFPRVVSTLHYRVLDLTKERFVALVCSTTGDGVPPNEAADLRDALVARDVVMPPACRFAVLALGDKAYPHFCRAGIVFDDLLGDGRLLDRVDVDQEDWPVIDDWIAAFQGAVQDAIALDEGDAAEEPEEDYLKAAMTKYAEAMENQEARFTRNEPFMATLVSQELLTAPKTGAPGEKEVVRVEFDVSGSSISYEVGDAVGIVPRNNSAHVARLLYGMASSGDDTVRVTEKAEPIRFEEALSDKLDIRLVKPELVLKLAQRAKESAEISLATKILGYDPTGANAAQQQSASVTDWGKEYLAAREVFDVLSDFVTATMTAQELTDLLRPLHARYYSISSTPVVTPNSIAATVDVLRYSSLNVEREGVASTFLKDRCQVNQTKVGLFISKNPNFRLPKDVTKPIIMIGPGTGLAPFIGFIEERVDQNATGENWLFFGCRREAQDFLYAKRLKEYADDGKIRLKTAFSRDTASKVYVQHRMAECGSELWQLMDKDGAHIYVCGDGGKMADDVDAAVRSIVEEYGKLPEEEARDYVSKLSETKRYQRDVWVS